MYERSLEELRLDDWQYCIHCRRVSGSLRWRRIPGQECCPYPDCESPFYGGSCPYRALRACYPDLPEHPEPGVVYAKNILTLLVSGYV